MGFYCLGMCLSTDHDKHAVDFNMVPPGAWISLSGFLVFWVESFFLGVGGYIAGDHLLRDLFLISSRATSGMAVLVGSSGGGLSTV